MMCGQENTFSLYLCDSHTSQNWKGKKKKKQENIGKEWLICVCYTFFTVDLSFLKKTSIF
jgi:hypothetical protein